MPASVPLTSLLHPRVYKLGLGATGKFEAIQELLDLLVSSHDLSLRQLGPAREAVFRNERARPSGTSSGAATPHAVVDGLRAPVAALGTSDGGIAFGGGTTVKVVLLMLTPSGGRAEDFVEVGALRTQSGVVEELVGAGNSVEAEQVLRDLAD